MTDGLPAPGAGSHRHGSVVELSDRLRGDLADDAVTVESVRSLLGSAIAVLSETFKPERCSWPYEVRRVVPPQEKPSPSTDSMIAFSLGVLCGDLSDDLHAPSDEVGSIPVFEIDSSIWRRSAEQLATTLSSLGRRGRHRRRADIPLLSSPTFGANDPFTLYWCHQLLAALQHPVAGNVDEAGAATRARTRVAAQAHELAEAAFENPQTWTLSSPTASDGSAPSSTWPPHVWPLVRVVHLAQAVGAPAPTAAVGAYLLERVLVQLSYSGIQDSQFDLGELVFALEGVALCDVGALRPALLERVATVVETSQQSNPSLRALTPFRITGPGAANTPVNVEVASALLRCCRLVERDRPSSALFARVHDVFDRYVEWLRSTVQTVPRPVGGSRSFRGWCSEHAASGEPTIHTWYTSQVVLFLAGYHAMLDRHLATSSLRAGRFSVATPSSNRRGWRADDPLPGLSKDSPYRIYERVDHAFVDRTSATPVGKGGSFLLYGPPGTGKTSLVRALAAELGWDMITITPSDFVVGGESQVEARAKDIFEVLRFQSRTVILFDEIDRLLLDRDSPEYGRQSDTFQFMTPAMLTKLADLNEQGRNIFCIATNYAWRIDRAITRPGRIDHRFLLLPPDRAARAAIVMELQGKKGEPDSVAREVAAKTPLSSYSELKAAHERARGAADRDVRESFVESCQQISPAAGVGPYRKTLESLARDTRVPPPALVEEFLLLRYLEIEGAQDQRAGVSAADWDLVGGRTALDQVRDGAVRGALAGS